MFDRKKTEQAAAAVPAKLAKAVNAAAQQHRATKKRDGRDK